MLCQERKENRHPAGLLSIRQLQGRSKTWHSIALSFNGRTGFNSQMTRVGKKRIIAFKQEGDGNKRALGYSHNSARFYSSKSLILNSTKTELLNKELRTQKTDKRLLAKERKKGINALKYGVKYGNSTNKTVEYAQIRGIAIRRNKAIPPESEFLKALSDIGNNEVKNI